MDEKKKIQDTITGVSVSDILRELKADKITADTDELNLDEVLAEFSDVRNKKEQNNPPVSKTNHEKPKPAEEKKLKKETPKSQKRSETEKTPKKNTQENRNIENTQAYKPSHRKPREIPDNSDTKTDIKLVENIVRPWENGVYGDMEIPCEKAKKEKKAKKKNTSRLAETFDTFTRSELFEEKGGINVMETRPVGEILAENKKFSRSLGLRSAILFLIGLLSMYLAFAEQLCWFMPSMIAYTSHPFRYLFLTAFFQILAMLISVDVVSGGLVRLFRLRPNLESAAAFSSMATLTHVITIMAAPQWHGWLPYSCISVMSLFFIIYAKWLGARSVCRICKVVRASKRPNLVRVESMYSETHVVKTADEDTRSFIAHINDKDASKRFWSFLSPTVIIGSIVFASVSSFGNGAPEHFFWALAGISSVSVPMFAMMSYLFPFSVTVKGLSSVGTAITGWFSASQFSKKTGVVVKDSDLFPKGTVSLHGLKILGQYSLEQTICYAASVIDETKCGLRDVFDDLLKSRYGKTLRVSNLRYHENGGVEAEVNGDSVLIGTSGFMLRSGIRLSSGTNVKNAVYVAINRQPAGVFNINYKANSEVSRALHMLVRKKIPVVLAVRDFNLLPTMLERIFDLRDGSLEYPETAERIDLSEEERLNSEDASAVITRSGLYPFASAVLASKKLRRATVRNVILTAACSLIGMLLMFYLTFIQRPALVTPYTVFVYMLLWCLPMYLLSVRVKR